MTTAPESHGIIWHTSSYSANGSACVEVATAADVVLIRDSKDRDGPALAVSAPVWRTFLRTITG